jgi:hypothetical protein
MKTIVLAIRSKNFAGPPAARLMGRELPCPCCHETLLISPAGWRMVQRGSPAYCFVCLLTVMEDPANRPAGYLFPSLADMMEVPGMLANLAQDVWESMSEEERRKYPHIGRMAHGETN